MKIGGVQVTKCEELLVLPREGGNIPFRAKAVSINEEFNKKCPVPVAPTIQKKGISEPDYSDKNYVQACDIRSERRFALMCIRSLEPSEIEWEVVDINKPGTWTKWQEELTEAGISEVECNRIVNLVMSANSLDESKIEEARRSFLLGQGE